jgi:hypothetical protein
VLTPNVRSHPQPSTGVDRRRPARRDAVENTITDTVDDDVHDDDVNEW